MEAPKAPRRWCCWALGIVPLGCRQPACTWQVTPRKAVRASGEAGRGGSAEGTGTRVSRPPAGPGAVPVLREQRVPEGHLPQLAPRLQCGPDHVHAAHGAWTGRGRAPPPAHLLLTRVGRTLPVGSKDCAPGPRRSGGASPAELCRPHPSNWEVGVGLGRGSASGPAPPCPPHLPPTPSREGRGRGGERCWQAAGPWAPVPFRPAN